jgi:hypothetical protein
MPRDGSGVFHVYTGTDGIANQTIYSAPYNANVHDIEQDLNTPRPIVAGGTGAANAADAMTNLGGELASQIVTNYDTFPFKPGSFYSGAGSTSEPVAGRNFAGICYSPGNPAYVTLEARDISSGALYVRQKVGGVWGAWVAQPSPAALDATYVNVAGDIMTGNITLGYSDPLLMLNKNASGHNNELRGTTAGLARWGLRLGDGTTESGSNNGSDFTINRFADAGNYIDTPFTLSRLDGKLTISGPFYVASDAVVYRAATPTTGNIFFGSGLTKSLFCDGTNFVFAGGGGVACAGAGAGSTPGLSNTSVGVSITPDPTLYVSKAISGAAVFNINVDGPDIYLCRSGAIVGSINVTATNTAYNTSSDDRLKDGFETFDAGRVIDDTNVYSFRWKATGERSYGVSAQQANEVYPAAVVYDEKADWWGIDYSRYVPVLLQELKALRARVAQLEAGMASKPA